MTHPTDEELDALVGMLQQRDKSKHGYTGHPLYNRNGSQAAAVITALRAQLAEARAEIRVTHACNRGLVRLNEATQARADRAEAALAAQIEADAGFVIAMKGNGWDENPATHPYDKGYIAACDTAISRICLQPHDRTALDRMLRAEREKALREAAELVQTTAYTSSGDGRSLEPVSAGLVGMDMHHATIATAILAMIEQPKETK